MCLCPLLFRCASSKTSYYTGERCQHAHMDGNIVGVLVGGAVGSVVLTLAIISVIRKPR